MCNKYRTNITFYFKRADIIVGNVVPHSDFTICFLGSKGIVLKCVPEPPLESQKYIFCQVVECLKEK